MPAYVLVCSLLLWPVFCSGQSTTDLLAGEVCDCLSEITELVYPRLQARKCLETTANRYAAEIKSELGLRVNTSGDLDRLAEVLASPLFEDCTLLQEIEEGGREPRLRYSDIPAGPSSKAFSSSKSPGPDPAEYISREVPATQLLTGTLIGADPPEELVIKIEAKEDTVRFSITSRQLRQLPALLGKVVTVQYRSEWRAEPARIVQVLININDKK